MNLRATLACSALLASPLVLSAANPPAPSAPRLKLGSTVFAWDKLAAKITPNGERREVANHSTVTLDVFECHITTLNPGKASHLPHRHAQEELIILKEGRVEVHIDGKTQEAGPGSAFFYASNNAHAIRNVGTTRATYWVINLATPTTHDPARHNAKPTLPSGVFDWEKLKVETTKTGDRRQVLKGSTCTMDNFTCHASSVPTGLALHGAHRHLDDEIVIVKEGTMEITIEGVPHRAVAGSVAFLSSNDLHGLRNAGDTSATYYIIRMITAATPKPPAK